MSQDAGNPAPTTACVPRYRDPISLYALPLLPLLGIFVAVALETEGIVSKSSPNAFSIGVGLLVLIAIALTVWVILSEYNYLTYLRNEVENQWHDIDVQFKRRAALIPEYSKLIERFLDHEHNTLTSMMDARKRSQGAASRGEKLEAEVAVSDALERVLVVVEAYPQIRTQANVSALQAELVNSENQIARFRLAYNSVTRFFNTVVERIPTCLIAARCGVQKAPYA